MQGMNISIPDPLKEFVDQQIASGRYGSVSEYIRELIREDEQKRQKEDDREYVETLDCRPLNQVGFQSVGLHGVPIAGTGQAIRSIRFSYEPRRSPPRAFAGRCGHDCRGRESSLLR